MAGRTMSVYVVFFTGIVVFAVPPEEAEGSISFSNDLLNMSTPGKLIRDSDSQLFA